MQPRKTKALYGAEARDALRRGIDAVFNAVAPTMGARGRNVVFKKWGMPVVTNDGVSIAREIVPEDPYEYLGAESLKQSSEQTNEEAGDGTSSTVVLSKSLIDAGTAAIDSGVDPMVLRREMEVGRDKVLEALKEIAVPVNDLKQVAQVSVEDEALAIMVSDLVNEVGLEGSIIVEETHGVNVRTEIAKGYTWNRGYVSPYMVTNQRGEAVLEKPAVIVTDRYMNLNTDLVEVMSELLKAGCQSILVVADNVEGELLQTIFANKNKGVINVVVVKKPDTKQELEDIAVLTGATAITSEKDIRKITTQHVGSAERVIISRDKAIIINSENEELVQSRIEEIREQITAEDHEKYGLIEALKTRLARLTGGVARIKVGAHTEAEQAYLKMKIDDAVGACRSALEEGIVAGGGTTLRDLTSVLDEEIPGESVLMSAMVRPYITILRNAGIDIGEGDLSVNYNVLTGEVIDDMMSEGIVDPAKVIRCALKNAVSIAGIILTTECAIADIPAEPQFVVQNQR